MADIKSSRAMVGVILGNALYQYTSWRWLFYIGIIVEVLAFVGTAFFYWPTTHPRGDFDIPRRKQFQQIDWIGLALFTLGLATALVGINWGGSSYPWKSAGIIAPIVLGFIVLSGAFAYDFRWAKVPIFPMKLFVIVCGFLIVLVVLFISGMNFHTMSALLPQGSLFMFTTDGIEIGPLSLPNTIMIGVAGVLVPLLSHKIGYIKWQFIVAATLQAIFIAISAATVNPNYKLA